MPEDVGGRRLLLLGLGEAAPELDLLATIGIALLLFVVTFVVNTAAELVRQRLRRRYARL